MNGILLVDKPVGISSQGAISVIKRALGVKKNWACWNIRSTC